MMKILGSTDYMDCGNAEFFRLARRERCLKANNAAKRNTSAFSLFLLILSLNLNLYFVPSANAKETNTSALPKYTVIAKNHTTIDSNRPPFHPCIEGARDDYVALSIQDEDVLRIFFYYQDGGSVKSFDVHNPSKRDFSGAPATNRSGVNRPGIIFADGTELDSYLPPDALFSGGTEWTFYMRWRRVWGNYYFVVRYLHKDILLGTDLMTERNGHDLSPVLGETSVNARMPKDYYLINAHEPELLYWLKGEKYPRLAMQLVPVEEKDLPPEFPKGLVRWIP